MKVIARNEVTKPRHQDVGGSANDLWRKSLRLGCFVVAMLLLATTNVAAVEKAEPVRVTAKALKNKIKVGDELRVLLQVEHPRKYELLPLPEKLDLSPFELKSADSPVKKGQNRVQETFGLTLTVFELGDLEVPPIPVRYKNASGETGEARSEPVPVKVVSVGRKLTDKDDIRPIKGPAALGLGRFRDWVLGILAALLAVFLAVKLMLRWMRGRREDEAKKPPHVRARLELERLKNAGLLEDKKIKEHYSGLSDILRRYLERAFKVEALERTTAELTQELPAKGFEPGVVEKVKNILQEADLIKFAKHVPERSLADRLESELTEVLDSTKPAEASKK